MDGERHLRLRASPGSKVAAELVRADSKRVEHQPESRQVRELLAALVGRQRRLGDADGRGELPLRPART